MGRDQQERAFATARHGWRAFAEGDTERASTAFWRALELGDCRPETIDAWSELQPSARLETLAANLLDQTAVDWPPGPRALLAARRFDALVRLDAPPVNRSLAALAVLEAAAGGDAVAWQPVTSDSRREPLLAALDSPATLLEALEHLSYAPLEAGFRDHAVSLAINLGYSLIGSPEPVRAVERVLFSLGATDAAYGLERLQAAHQPRLGDRQAPDPMSFIGQTLLLNGGHDALRVAAREDLLRSGAADVRFVPPSWEGQRGDSLALSMPGVDLVIAIIRQLDHSTGDRVKAAARRAGVRVTQARTATVSAIREAAQGRGHDPI